MVLRVLVVSDVLVMIEEVWVVDYYVVIWLLKQTAVHLDCEKLWKLVNALVCNFVGNFRNFLDHHSNV